MYSISEEGEVVRDFSADRLIPGGMCQGSFVVLDGKIYAVGWRMVDCMQREM